VHELSRLLGREGIDLVTGGGPGLMDAASTGHHAGDVRNVAHSIGLRIKLMHEQSKGNFLEIEKVFKHFSRRLDAFVGLSNVVVVAPGGIGTLLELVYIWQLVQVKQICETPIILYGKQWAGLVKWMKHDMLREKLIGKDDMKYIFTATTPSQAMSLVKKFHAAFKNTPNVCTNVSHPGRR
jgi:uncharacterized protein (TIGR00730 family)